MQPWSPAVGASVASSAPAPLHIDAAKGTMTVNGKRYTRKDVLSIDGSTGQVMVGEVKRIVPNKISGDFAQILKWSDSAARMKVRTNADAPADAKRARDFGRSGHRPLPNRAHVLPGRPHQCHA